MHSVLPALFLLLMAGYVLAGVPLVPFHGDESTQMYMGRDTYYLFTVGQPGLVSFRRDPDELPQGRTQQELRLLNGTIAKTLFGAVSIGAGLDVDAVNQQWQWGGGWDYNVDQHSIPRDDVLNGARTVSALFLAAGLVALFTLAWRAIGPMAAYSATALVALNPAVLVNGRRAIMEGPLLGLSLLLLLLALLALRRLQRRWEIISPAVTGAEQPTHDHHRNPAAVASHRPSDDSAKPEAGRRALWLWLPAVGIAGGLTLAGKHTGVVVLAAVLLAIVALAIVLMLGRATDSRQPHRSAVTTNPAGQRRWLMDAGLQALVIGVVAAVVFFALNPAWWSAPIDAARSVISLRSNLLQGQVDAFGGYTDGWQQAQGFLRNVLVWQPQYYEVSQWGSFDVIRQQIAQYEASGLQGLTAGIVPGVVLAALSLAGGGLLFLQRRMLLCDRVLLVAYCAVSLLFCWLATPLDWQRYYLPAIPPIALLAGITLQAAAGWLMTQRAKPHDDTTMNKTLQEPSA